MQGIKVKKRFGESEPFNLDKIHDVLFWATNNISNVSVSDIEVNLKLQLYDGIPSLKIHKLLISSAVDLISEEYPNYQIVASNLLNFYIRKDVFNTSDSLPSLLDVIKKNVELGIYDKEILEIYSEKEIIQLNGYIRHSRDYNFVYSGLQQVVDKYLIKDRHTKKLYETPQYMYMLISMTVNGFVKNNRLKSVKEYYNLISTFKISLPTPIMSGVRSPSKQYSSCTLIDVGDDLKSIFNSNTAVGYYIANRAGVGLNFGRVRALGSKIRNGEVIHTGVIPFLKMFEASTRSCTQNGVRGGNSTTHFPFWHREIMDILPLKNNRGTDDNRVRKIDYSIQFNNLFYKRFVENKEISLFCPNDTGDLYELFFTDTDKFTEMYNKFESSDLNRNKVMARDLFVNFCKERLETGRMYVMNVDHCNTHSSFLDTVYMSNLCQEITLPTSPIEDVNSDKGEIALCVLSAINVSNLKKDSNIEAICYNILKSLDYIIDNQYYPVVSSEKIKKRRSVGIGITNLAYYLAKHGLRYDDKGSIELVDKLGETIQYFLLKASNRLAKERGKCEWFERTKYSKGILPIDTYNKNVDNICNRNLFYDWEELREDILKYGLRNSTLTAVMPCESSSLVSNSTNGIEPPRSLVSVKKSKQGLIPQVVPEIQKLKNKYTLAYNMKDNRGIINISAVLQKYFDQSISTNLYYNYQKYEENKIPMSEFVDDILYSYKMGLKTLYYSNTDDGKTEDNLKECGCDSGACKI